MKRLFSFIIASAATLTAAAQIHLSVELNNNHLWRGIEVADGCVVETDLNYTFAKGHMTLGLWGGTNTQGTYKEFNHYLSIQGAGFKFSAWDTYNFSPGATYNNRQYFNYSAHETGRFLNCTLDYRFQQPQFPLLLSWSTIMFGRQHRTEIFYVCLCRISRLQERRMAGGCWRGWSLRPKQGWRRPSFLRHNARHRPHPTEG